jgi:hypothetical protein
VASIPVQSNSAVTIGEQFTRTGQLGLTPMRLEIAFAGRRAWEKDARSQEGVLSSLDTVCGEHEGNYPEVGRSGTAGVEQTYVV